jgi:hypothetical protein
LKLKCLSLLCSTSVVLTAQVSFATVQELVQYEINGAAGISGNTPTFNATHFTSSSDPLATVTLDKDSGGDFAGGSAAGNSTTRAAQGVLGVYAHALAVSSGYLTAGNVTVQSYADMTDKWTFKVVSRDGALLHVKGSFKLSGSQTAKADGADHQPGGYMDTVTAVAESHLSVTGNGIPPGPYQNGWYAYDQEDMNTNAVDTNVHLAAPQYIYVDTVYYASVPKSVSYDFELDQSVSVVSNDFVRGGTALAQGDFSHTLIWDGITSVTDEQGNPVTDWTLSTESGVDFAHAIQETPEPSTAVLLLTAIPLTYFLRRRNATGTTHRR